MERTQGRTRKSQFLNRALKFALVGSLTASPLLATGGTRLIPPPPPRHQNDSTVNGVEQTSEWGKFAGAVEESTRFEALQDDEGQEIDFNRGSYSRNRVVNRAPAGLEVTGHGTGTQAKSDENAAGWKTSPMDQSRSITKEATTSEGKRPVLRRITKTEAARQEVETEKFVSETLDPVARRKGVQEISIIAGDLGFFPKTIFVSRDVPVRLYVTGASKGSLCIMMDSFNVRKQVRANKIEEITFVPNQPGTYRYYCPVNGSEGTMVVKELTTNTLGEG